MRRRAWPSAAGLTAVVLALAAIGSAANVRAASDDPDDGERVSLRRADATLHEILTAISAQTGLSFMTDEGAGRPGFQEPPAARRLSMEWERVPLGHALRRVCAHFGLQASPRGDGGYWFYAGGSPKRRETVAGGHAISISGVVQAEDWSLTPGRPEAQVRRRLSFHLTARALDGIGSRIRSIDNVVLVTDTDRTITAPDERPRPYSAGLPDERDRQISIDWQGEHARSLKAIRGVVSSYRRSATYRLSFPTTQASGPVETGAGPIRLTIERLQNSGRRLDAVFRLRWPDDVDISTQGQAGVRLFLRWADGRRERIYATSTQGRQGGLQFASFELSQQHSPAPEAIEIMAPARWGEAPPAPFELRDVPLPFGRPLRLVLQPQNQPLRPRASFGGGENRLPSAFADREGGSLELPPAPAAPEGGRVLARVGLAARSGAGDWGPIRWLQLEVTERPPVIRYLAPGAYRVRVQYWLRRGNAAPVPSGEPERLGTATIRKGVTVRLAP